MMEKDLRRISIYFNSDDDDFTSVHDVDMEELSFNLMNGTRQKWLEFKTEKDKGKFSPILFVNLDNVTAITVDPKERTLEEKVEQDVPNSLIENLFKGSFYTILEQKMKAWNAFESLTDRGRMVIERRFGFYGRESMDLCDVAKSMSVTRERVRQIEIKALKQMRSYIYGSLTADPFAVAEED